MEEHAGRERQQLTCYYVSQRPPYIETGATRPAPATIELVVQAMAVEWPSMHPLPCRTIGGDDGIGGSCDEVGVVKDPG